MTFEDFACVWCISLMQNNPLSTNFMTRLKSQEDIDAPEVKALDRAEA